MNLIKELSKKKYIQILIVLFMLELIMSFQLKAYYYYFFEKNTFQIIDTYENLYYFNKTMNLLLEDINKNNILILNIVEPSNYLIKIIPCDNNITKVILLPSSLERINLYGTHLKGCYVIETYFFNDELVQHHMEKLFKKIILKINEEIVNEQDVILRINEIHYKWINFIRIINFQILSNPLFNYHCLLQLNIEDEKLISFIKQKTIFSWQSMTLHVLNRAIKLHHLFIFIMNKIHM